MFQNVGELLARAAQQWPGHPAVAEPSHGNSWRSLTYDQLNTDCDRIANGLVAHGVEPGMRMVLLVPPGIDFVTLVFALFKTGAVVVLIDPGIGRRNLVRCISEVDPRGVVGVPKAHLARWWYRRRLPGAKNNFVVGPVGWPGCQRIQQFRDAESPAFETATRASDAAAIIFTSGSTGPPKGVLYEHGNFINQAEEIRRYFEIEPGGADISGFPLFALFNTSMGKTTVFPRMNFTRPASIDPREFIRATEHWQADQAFGSPALLNTVSCWCESQHHRLSGIRRVLSAGAPVPAHVLKRVKRMIDPDGDVYTPYGATEALPIACNSASIVLRETASQTDRGAGVCVGSRFGNIQWKVIDITDEPIESIEQAVALPTKQIGELIVTGPVVTRCYVSSPEANALHKIKDGDRIWHRMGDVGYLDDSDRFWICGRKSHRVVTTETTMFTIPCESIFNTHPVIYRSALVGIGPRRNQTPALVAEPWPDYWPATRQRRQRLIAELKELATQHELTRGIHKVYLRRKLPVDIRHNSKIFREQIARWVARQN